MQILNMLVRLHLPLAQFDDAVAFHERMTGQKARLRLDLEPAQPRIAQIASLLVIGAPADVLAEMEGIRAAYLVEDIDAFAARLPLEGARILKPLAIIATGRNMLVRHPDGMLVEYVEHDHKHPADRMIAPMCAQG